MESTKINDERKISTRGTGERSSFQILLNLGTLLMDSNSGQINHFRDPVLYSISTELNCLVEYGTSHL